MALFSKKKDAIPIVFFHGWPGTRTPEDRATITYTDYELGCFLEFIGLLTTMKSRYTPETLPYNLIVPSLIGYTLSPGPPTDRDWSVADTSRLMHKLVLSLGFKSYAVQGGDVGAGIARILGVQYEECKAVLLNADTTGKPEGADGSEIEEVEKEGVERWNGWRKKGVGYAVEHGSRPGTVGLALSSSPVALLAWYNSPRSFLGEEKANESLGSQRNI
jgi:microsomal epoxide hydrolase